jgi:hypothetical protein
MRVIYISMGASAMALIMMVLSAVHGADMPVLRKAKAAVVTLKREKKTSAPVYVAPRGAAEPPHELDRAVGVP